MKKAEDSQLDALRAKRNVFLEMHLLQQTIRMLSDERRQTDGLKYGELATKIGCQWATIARFLKGEKAISDRSEAFASILKYAKSSEYVRLLSDKERQLLDRSEEFFRETDLSDRELSICCAPAEAISLMFDLFEAKHRIAHEHRARIFANAFPEPVREVVQDIFEYNTAALASLYTQNSHESEGFAWTSLGTMVIDRIGDGQLPKHFQTALEQERNALLHYAEAIALAFEALQCSGRAIRVTCSEANASESVLRHAMRGNVSLVTVHTTKETLEKLIIFLEIQKVAIPETCYTVIGRARPSPIVGGLSNNDVSQTADAASTSSRVSAHDPASKKSQNNQAPSELPTQNRDPVKTPRQLLCSELQTLWKKYKPEFGTVSKFSSAVFGERSRHDHARLGQALAGNREISDQSLRNILTSIRRYDELARGAVTPTSLSALTPPPQTAPTTLAETLLPASKAPARIVTTDLEDLKPRASPPPSPPTDTNALLRSLPIDELEAELIRRGRKLAPMSPTNGTEHHESAIRLPTELRGHETSLVNLVIQGIEPELGMLKLLIESGYMLSRCDARDLTGLSLKLQEYCGAIRDPSLIREAKSGLGPLTLDQAMKGRS